MNGELPRISVGVPTFNQGKYIEATLLSLLNQELCPYEIVVSDNHSTDETSDILRKFRERIKIIKPIKHLGMVENWSFTASNLNGDWLALLSSDDIAFPNYVRTLAESAIKFPEAALIRAPFEVMDADGRYQGTEWLYSVPARSSPRRSVLEQTLNPKVGFAAFAMRKSAYEKVGGFPKLELLGDWGMWLLLATEGEFVKAREAISVYRRDYRPNLLRERIFGFIRDGEILTKEIFPFVANKIGCGFKKRLNEFANARFRLVLSSASEALQGNSLVQERQIVATLLLQRAIEAKGEKLLDAFLRGEKIVFDFPGGRCKKILRTIRTQFQKMFRTKSKYLLE